MNGIYTEEKLRYGNGTRTIKATLNTFFYRTLFFFLILLVACLFTLLQNQWHYQRNYRKLFLLNDFYSKYEQLNEDAFLFARDGYEDTYENLVQTGQKLDEELGNLYRVTPDKKFRRDVRDIRILFEEYLANLSSIRTLKAEQDSTATENMISSQQELISLQEDNDTIYGMVVDEFKTLYSKLLNLESQDNDQWRRMITIFYLVFLTLCAIAVLLSIHTSSVMSEQISRPILMLASHTAAIWREGWEEHYEQIQIPDIENVETQTLVDGFNRMISRLKQTAAEREDYLRTQLELKEKTVQYLKLQEELRSNQLKVIQAQINPHFLFNTLNMISQTAYFENAQKTMELLGRTASLLRYYLDFSDKQVALSKELACLKNYTQLQQVRFSDRITFLFLCDNRCDNCYVPSQILQPVVENAIIHGVGSYSSGARICVETQYLAAGSQARIRIIVRDNGVGMNEEEVQSINDILRRGGQTGKHLGLGSIAKKFQYYYGENASVMIESEPGVDTTVLLEMPANRPLSPERKEA